MDGHAPVEQTNGRRTDRHVGGKGQLPLFGQLAAEAVKGGGPDLQLLFTLLSDHLRPT